jgi:hypothetical protein
MAKVNFEFGSSGGFGGRGEGLMDMNGEGWGAINEDEDMDFM